MRGARIAVRGAARRGARSALVGCRRRVHSELGPDFDETYEDYAAPLGPALPGMFPLQALEPLLPFVVRVGNGSGVLMQLHRDVARTPLRLGDLVIATATTCVFPHKGIDGLVKSIPRPLAHKQAPDGGVVPVRESFDIPVRALWTHRRASLSDTSRSNVRTDETGFALIVPDERAAHAICRGAGAEPPRGARDVLQPGWPMQGAHWCDKSGSLIGSLSSVHGLNPYPMCSFEPEWRQCFAGGPLCNVLNPGRRRQRPFTPSLPREPIGPAIHAIAVRYDHSQPYNPEVQVVDVNAAVQQPMCMTLWKDGRWVDTWWNGPAVSRPGFSRRPVSTN